MVQYSHSKEFYMRKILKSSMAALAVSVFILWPMASFADDHHHDSGNHGGDHHDHGHYDHGHHDHAYIGLNFGIWPDSYYYGPTYYAPSDEVLVSPPVYQPVVINGITYYLNNGSYYVYNGYGYQPVAAPAVAVQQPVVVAQQPEVIAPTVQEDAFTINIPNDKGGYTAVTLKKSGNGFIGPQGEFYPEFPKVSQLKVIYGK
jgi:hypothetical protein